MIAGALNMRPLITGSANAAKYISLMQGEGIFAGISSGDGFMTRENEIKLLYNILLAGSYESNAVSGVTKKGGELLYTKYGIERHTGLVTGDFKTLMTAPVNAEGRRSRIQIDGVWYETENDVNGDFVGDRVVYFINREENTLVYAGIDAQQSSAVSAKGSDTKIVSTYAEVTTEKGAVRRVRIDEGAAVIYNGVYYRNFSETAKELLEAAAELVFTDNTGDGRINIIKAYGYRIEKVNTVDKDGRIFVGESGRKYCFDGSDT